MHSIFSGRMRSNLFLVVVCAVWSLMTAAGAAVVATGGDATNDFGDYRIHVFTNVGVHYFVTSAGEVEYLVVGGGGAVSGQVGRDESRD